MTTNIKKTLPSSSKGVHVKRRNKTMGRSKGKVILDAQTVREHIERGFSPAMLAKKFGVSREAAGKAVAKNQREMLAEIMLRQSESTPFPMPEVGEVPTSSPIDIMGEVMSVIEDLRSFRAWLVTDEAKRIPLHRRLEYFFRICDTKLQWASRFIEVYGKLLDLVAFDTWLHVMLDIAERHAPGAREKIKEELRDRLYGRVVGDGTYRPTSPIPPGISSTFSPPA